VSDELESEGNMTSPTEETGFSDEFGGTSDDSDIDLNSAPTKAAIKADASDLTASVDDVDL
jgi:hypothetical protein